MLSQERFEANLRFFQSRFPALYPRLTQGSTLAKPIVENGVLVDADLGSGRLYKEDGHRLGQEQARMFLAAPARSGYRSVEGITGDSIVSRRFHQGMVEGLAALGVRQLNTAPYGQVGFAFVFGVGLGYHLPVLAEELEVDHLVVVEAVDEFLRLSLQAIDWVALHGTLSARGAKLHLVVSPDPATLSQGINAIVDNVGEMFLDGCYIYRHYPYWPLDQAYHRLLDDIPTRLVSRGYYEDERKMVRHAAANLHKFPHYLIRGNFRRRYDTPAFIVAAGPSVDEAIDYLRQWQNHGIIFCAGTTLQVLVKAGIIPDYHVELENVAATRELCMHIVEQRPDLFPNKRFDGVKMIASVTVNPMVPPLFDEHYFFFRDSVTSTHSFGEGVKLVDGVGPSISNTCVSLAARLGFETMYLFGVDCGWRDGRTHHSKDTIYYTLDGHKRERFEGAYSSPGNFGGTIQADTVLTWTRDMIEQKIERYRLKVFNCSDGAFIRGSTPKLAETLSFNGPGIDKPAVFKRIRDESEHFAAGAFLAGHDMARYPREVDLLRDDFVAFMAQCRRDNVDFRQFSARITDFHREGYLGPYRHIFPLYQGSLLGFSKAASYFLTRIDDEPAIRAGLELFFRLYEDLHLEMLDEGRTMFAEAQAMVEDGIEPWWADGLPRVPGTTY